MKHLAILVFIAVISSAYAAELADAPVANIGAATPTGVREAYGGKYVVTPVAHKYNKTVVSGILKTREKMFEERPGEVVIKGSKIKENLLRDDEIEMISSGTVETEEDLRAYAVAVSQKDRNIEQMSLSYGKISIDYRYPAKLFGFIDVSYTHSVEADTQGRVKVKTPWWLFFAQSNAKAVTESVENRTSEERAALHAIQNDLQKQQHLFNMLSNVMKIQSDTSKSAVNNMK